MDSRRSSQSSARPLRAIVELDGGELKIFPIAQSDAEEKLILDALRFVVEDHESR